jgi:hypothetical protein
LVLESTVSTTKEVRMVHKVIMALAGRYAGRDCRRCTTPIDRRNAFGMSEGVCPSCAS